MKCKVGQGLEQDHAAVAAVREPHSRGSLTHSLTHQTHTLPHSLTPSHTLTRTHTRTHSQVREAIGASHTLRVDANMGWATVEEVCASSAHFLIPQLIGHRQRKREREREYVG